MLDTGRRSILAGLSAAPAAIVAATLTTAVLARPAAPDAMSAEVAELTRLYDAAMARTAKALEACEAAEERLMLPAAPEALFVQQDDPLSRVTHATRHDDRFWYGDDERIDILRNWPVSVMPSSKTCSPAMARRAQVIAAYDQWQAARKAAKDVAGVTAADTEYRAAWDEQEKPIRQRILELRSVEPAVLRLKVKLYLSGLHPAYQAVLDESVNAALTRENGPFEEAMGASILRDIALAYAPSDT